MPTATVEPGQLDLHLYRGDEFTLALTFTDTATPPAPLPLTGTFRAHLRASADATDTPTSFTIDSTNAATGELVLSLADTVVATLGDRILVWDLEQTLPGGSVRTLLAGKVFVQKDVTR